MTILITALLVLLSGLFSGLSLGLMSLDPYELKRKIALGDKQAQRIYPLRKRGNLLLVTLLLSNVAVNAALSLFLGSLVSGILAGLMSTVLITLFGEIVPQAIFSRFALSLGARLIWFVYIFTIVLFPICAPVAWALDKILGNELPTIYSRSELIKILEEHRSSDSWDVMAHEERIANGALTFGEKRVSSVMTSRENIVAIEGKTLLTKNIIQQLKDSAHSRFPVYSKKLDSITGMLYLKDLANLKAGSHRANQIQDKSVKFINDAASLDQALSAFIKTKKHLFVVINVFDEVMGVLSIEDVLEEIIGQEILDEYDTVTDLSEKRGVGFDD